MPYTIGRTTHFSTAGSLVVYSIDIKCLPLRMITVLLYNKRDIGKISLAHVQELIFNSLPYASSPTTTTTETTTSRIT